MKKSLYTKTPVRIITVPVTGLRSGNTTLVKVLIGPAPSIAAAYSYSLGVFLKNAVYKKIAIGISRPI